MMVASAEAILNGISAAMILTTGFLIAIRLFVAIRTNESKLLPVQGFFAASFGSYYLGTVVSFISLLAVGVNIDENLAGILCYTVSPLGIACAMYIGFSMIKPKLAKPITIAYALTAILFWANLWFNFLGTPGDPAIGWVPYDRTVDLVDIELGSLSNFFTAFYILSSLVLLGGGFIWLAGHATGDIRARARNYAIGLIGFSICGIIDSRGIVSGIGGGLGIFIVRIFMVVSYLFLYKAMVPPKSSFPPVKSK
jgi:hypothetical protein